LGLGWDNDTRLWGLRAVERVLVERVLKTSEQNLGVGSGEEGRKGQGVR
jgi:hypothetical protein